MDTYATFSLVQPRSLPWGWEVLQNRGHLAEAPWDSWLHAGVRVPRKWQRRVDLQTCGWVCLLHAFLAYISAFQYMNPACDQMSNTGANTGAACYLKSMTVLGTIVNIWQQSRHKRWVCERPRPSLSSANTTGRDVGMIGPWVTQLINPTLHIHSGYSTSQKYSVVGTTGHFHKAGTQLYCTFGSELST